MLLNIKSAFLKNHVKLKTREIYLIIKTKSSYVKKL